MEPIVAGGLVLGVTLSALVFVSLCSMAADRIYDTFFASREREARVESLPTRPASGRRSA